MFGNAVDGVFKRAKKVPEVTATQKDNGFGKQAYSKVRISSRTHPEAKFKSGFSEVAVLLIPHGDSERF